MTTDENALFARGPSITIRLVIVVALSLILMALDHRMQRLTAARSALAALLQPVYFLADLPVRSVEWLGTALAERRRLLADNERLRERQLIIAARLQTAEDLAAENRRLRALLQSAARIDNRVLIGRLLSVDLDPYKHRLVLDKGTKDAAFVGQPLLDAHGVMGQLVQVSAINAIAMLITDPNHAIPVRFSRNNIRTIAIGTGNLHRLDLPHLPNHVDAKVGDLLVTSGLGGRFPPGYPVARVTEIDADPTGGSFARITAAPLAQLDRTREVLLVWSVSSQNRRLLTLDVDHPERNTADPE